MCVNVERMCNNNVYIWFCSIVHRILELRARDFGFPAYLCEIFDELKYRDLKKKWRVQEMDDGLYKVIYNRGEEYYLYSLFTKLFFFFFMSVNISHLYAGTNSNSMHIPWSWGSESVVDCIIRERDTSSVLRFKIYILRSFRMKKSNKKKDILNTFWPAGLLSSKNFRTLWYVWIVHPWHKKHAF